MKKQSVVINIIAALAVLLVNLNITSGTLASSPLASQALPNATIAATGGGGVLSIPAAAFAPFEDGYDFENHGRYLLHLHSPGGGTANGWYLAPVDLPHGAVVTKLTFYFKDTWIVLDGIARLQRTRLGQGDYQEMASVDSSGAGSGYTSKSTTTISDATIDNVLNAYWVIWDIPYTASAWSRFEGCGVLIFYTPPTTVTGRISIPAAAFSTPHEDGYDFENHGRFLIHYHSPGGGTANGWYHAPLQLPHGATVTKMTFYFKDTWIVLDGIARLQRTEFNQGDWKDMATVDSSGAGGGYTSKATTAISDATIDNSRYAYWVIWDVPYTHSAWSRFEGCGVVIEYTLPAVPGGLLSIPAAAFSMPHEDGYDFENHGRFMFHLHSPGGGAANGWYHAPVQLPHRATVTKMSFYWYDNSSADGVAKLQRTQLGQGNYEDMAYTDTSTTLPYVFFYDADLSITNPFIDNSQYAYWVIWDLPIATGATHLGAGDVAGCGVVIEFSFRIYLPTVKKDI